jgi:hypothetical protein
VGIPKLPRLGLLQLWGAITLRVGLRWRWGFKQSCILRQKLFNGMSHVTCTQGNRVDSWLLMVGNQIANLTPILSFGHNLCFRCPNGWCEPFQTSTFQELSNDIRNALSHWVLTPAIVLWRFGSPSGLQFPKWNPLGVWGFIPSHPLTLPAICCVTSGFLLGSQPCKPLP